MYKYMCVSVYRCMCVSVIYALDTHIHTYMCVRVEEKSNRYVLGPYVIEEG